MGHEYLYKINKPTKQVKDLAKRVLKMDEIMQKIINHVAEIYPSVEIPEIRWNSRMRTTSGRYFTKSNHIELNPHLLDTDEKLTRTLYHELAHAVEMQVFKYGGHGATWKAVMRRLGRKPERCHSYDTKGLKRKHRVVAKATCGCPERVYEIKTVRYRKIKKGAKYQCQRCFRTIQLIETKGVSK